MAGGYKRQGNEFLVNTTRSGNQNDSSLASLAGGGFVVTWTDPNDGGGTGIRAQIFNAVGIAESAEFIVNSTVLANQSGAAVTGLASGNFVVSWTDDSRTGGDSSGTSIKAQLFSANGARLGAEFLVNTSTAAAQTAVTVTALANGGFVASWTDSSLAAGDTSGTAIRAQLFDATGGRVGTQFLVNTVTAANQATAAISALADGGFVVTWSDASLIGGDNSSTGIKAQRYDAGGIRAGNEFLVNTTIALNQTAPVVATLASGKFVIAWNDTSRSPSDPSGAAVRAQIFNSDGTRSGGELLVNTTTLYNQQQPTITALPAGGFAIAWTDNSIRLVDYSGSGIKMQMFDDIGGRVGSEFTVNTATASNQDQPAIIAMASGEIIVSWTDNSRQGTDTSGTGIKAQIFSPYAGTISDIALSLTTLSEAAAQNTVAAVFSNNGAINGNFSYTLLSDSTGGAFLIDGNRLIVADSLKLDFETTPSVDITVLVTDGFGNSTTEMLSIGIENALRESRFAAGDDVLVNTTIQNDQVTPAITKLIGGGFVVSWMDNSLLGADRSANSVRGQLYDAYGVAVGNEFVINTITASNQTQPTLAALEDGGFVAIWTDTSGRNGPGSAVVGQRYGDTGARVGGEFLVGSTTSLSQTDAAVTGLADGGFAVSWTDGSGQNGDSNSAVLVRRFDATGAPITGPLRVNVETAGVQDQSTIAALPSGGFVVGWRDGSGIGVDNSSSGIKARLFDASGNASGGEFVVNTEVRSTQLQPIVASLAGGGFVFAWTDNSSLGGDPDYYGIKAQIFDDVGGRFGGEFLVNTSTANAQQSASIAALASGGFVIGWFDFSGNFGEAGGSGVRAQSFNKFGDRLGTEIAVNAETLGSQADPALAGLASGAFVVAYTDASGNGGDNIGTSVKARIFTPLIDPSAPPALRAIDDATTGVEEQSQIIMVSDILANEINGNFGILGIESITAVVGGTVAFDIDGNIVFTPNPNFDGRAAFDYRVADGTGATDIGRVFIQVAGTNDAPTANPDSVNAIGSGTIVFSAASLTANDTDPDTVDVKLITAVPAFSNLGIALGIVSGNVTYALGQQYQSLTAGQDVIDSFTYTITDSGGLTSTTAVTVTIVGANDAPFGLALSNTTIDENSQGGTVVGTATASDVDTGDVLTYSLSNTAGGRFAINAQTGIITVAAGAVLDFETAAAHLIRIVATDIGGASVSANWTISLNDLPEARTYTGDNGANSFTAPTNDVWTIIGLGGNDVLTGNASADTIFGGTGADTLDGAGGADMMFGGTGNDIYFVDNIDDTVIELLGEGIDVIHASVTFTLGDFIENLAQTGTGDIDATGNSFNNTIDGNSGNNILAGVDGRDLLRGNDGNDTLIGGDGGDWLVGGDGDDILIGGPGLDDLIGGAGADRFVLDRLTVSTDRDRIRDFEPGTDKIDISVAAFAAFAGAPLGTLSPSSFMIGTAALMPDQHLIYTPGTGALFYDADGSGPDAAVQIALLNTFQPITSTDFNLIA